MRLADRAGTDLQGKCGFSDNLTLEKSFPVDPPNKTISIVQQKESSFTHERRHFSNAVSSWVRIVLEVNTSQT